MVDRRRYVDTYDGDWVFPVMSGCKIKCCDCGVVHAFKFKIVRGIVAYQPTRDRRATASARRHMTWEHLMPLTKKGAKIKAAMTKEYGAKKGTSVFYASRNKGTITGVDPESSRKAGRKKGR